MTPSHSRFGRYLLVEPLGAGGMAQVWRARVEGTDGFSRDLVIKRILKDRRNDPELATLFAREARLLAMLRHANIVQVFEYGEVDGEPYLTMEYLDGVDLHRFLAQFSKAGERLSPGSCAFIAREIARALKHLHEAVDETGQPLGLVHRDISPSNVFLGLDGSVKLLDFGIAKTTSDRSLTTTGGFRGKVAYAAPEVVEGQAHEARSDVFALGVVLHEMLSGRRLFSAPSDLQTLGLVRAASVRPPSTIAPDVPGALDAICLKALARLPGDRFESAQALLTAIDPIVHELQSGPEQLAALVATRRARVPTSETSTVADAGRLGLEKRAARAPRRRWLLGIAALVAVAASVGFGVNLLGQRPSPTPLELPAPVAAPAPAAAAPVDPAPTPAPATPPPEAPSGATVKTPVMPLKHRARKKQSAKVPSLEDGNVVDPFPGH